MTTTTGKTDGAPHIERTSAKVAALERRIEYLEAQLDEGELHGGARNFARAELSALGAAIKALKFHRAEVEGLDGPVLALAALVDAMAGLNVSGHEEKSRALEQALERGRRVLAEWE